MFDEVVMRDKDILEKRKKARGEITRPPEEFDRGKGEFGANNPFFIAPVRALADDRMYKKPAAFRILCLLCSYANRDGVCYPNQKSLAERMGTSQQAISKQIVLIEAWGYIKKLQKHNRLRQFGRKGTTYRIIYDPGVSDKELESKSVEEVTERGKAKDTIDQIQREVVQPEVVKDAENTTRSCVGTQPNRVVSNTPCVTSNINIKGNVKEVIEFYIEQCEKEIGNSGGFRWDFRQEAVVEDLLNQGVTVQQWKKQIMNTVSWHKKEGRRPPFSMSFFKDRFNEPKIEENSPDSISKILKKLGNKKKR